MITRIELTNFMSHERTVIEPAEGLTVLVGPNNCGKSAVVAALQILCHNADSTYVTRHGEKQCSVCVETDDGHRVQWQRKTAASYSIDGVKFDRLGRNNVPDQLLKVLRLPHVEIGDDQLFNVHFGEQKTPIFLLDRPASHAAKFFASSSDVDRFLKMQDLHRTKVAEAKAQKQRLDQESIGLNHELELLEPLVDLDTCLADAEKEYRTLEALAKLIDEISVDSEELNRQAMMVDCSAAWLKSFEGLSSPPELEPTESQESLLDEIGQCQGHLSFISEQVAAVRELTVPPALAPIEVLTALVEEIDCASRALAHKHDRLTALTPIVEPPQLEDVDAFARLREDLAKAGQFFHRSNDEINELALLSTPPQLGDEIGLAATLRHLIEATRSYAHSCQRNDLLVEVPSPLVVEEVVTLEKLLSLLRDSVAQTLKCSRSKELLSGVEAVPEQADTAALADVIDRLKTAAQSVTDNATLAERVNDDFAQTKQGLLSWARANGICPTCGGPIDAERLVAHLSYEGDAPHA
jgi:RNA polymerase-binding transcription factor DksA